MAGKKKTKSPIVNEMSFTGSAQQHKDGSIFLFVDVQSNEGNETRSLSLTKEEVKGVEKFLSFCQFGS